MQYEELLNQTQELKQIMRKAAQIAERLQNQMPEIEEPALTAQCSVIRAFLRQTERQEQVLAQMLKSRMTGETAPVRI